MKTSRFIKNFLDTKQSGVSLLATVFALGVTVIVISAFTTSFSNKAFMGKQLSSQQQFEDLNQLIANSIVTKFNNVVDRNCLRGRGGVRGVFREIDISGAKLKFTERPNRNELATPGSSLSNSINRCSSVVEMAPSSSSSQAPKHYHFCLELEKDNAAPKNSFLGSDFGLVEVTIEPINSISNEPLDCSIFRKTGNDLPAYAALRVSFRAYWGQTKTAKKFRYFKRDGQFIASAQTK